jgi:hypothetical protein
MEMERLPLGQSLSDRQRASALRWRGMPPGIPPEMANEFVAKLKAGSTIRKLTGGGELGPAMVSYDRFKKHCEQNPVWAAEARAISDANSKLAKGSRLRNLTHCRRGHPFSGANLYIFPSGKERGCRTCMNYRDKFNRRMSEDQARRVVEALRQGETIATITTGGSPTYVVNNRALSIFRLKSRP